MGSRFVHGTRRGLAASVAAIVSATVLASTPAIAFTLLGGQWADEDSISYFVEAGGVTATAFTTAKNNWNTEAPAIHFVSTSEEREWRPMSSVTCLGWPIRASATG